MDPEFLNRNRIEDFEIYKQVAHSKDWWLLSSDRLKRAADCLKTHYKNSAARVNKGEPITNVAAELELILQYGMLIGYSFENLLKGRLVEFDPSKIHVSRSGTGFELKWGSHGHDLWDLANELSLYCQLDLADKDEELLNYLTLFMLWKGRYPIPKSERYLAGRAGVNEIGAADFNLIDQLYFRIRSAKPI